MGMFEVVFKVVCVCAVVQDHMVNAIETLPGAEGAVENRI
jgi:hypothetical protein